MTADVVAGVDIGTNSVRLLLASPDGSGGLRPIDRRMTITRLGQDVDRTGRLDPAAVARTLDVLAVYHRRWDEAGAGAVRITATSAARDAADAVDLLDRVEATTGVRPEVLPGHEEATLAYRGAVAGSPVAGAVVVLDIGGGSTEMVRGAGLEVQAADSRQIGSVRLTEQALPGDPPTAGDVAAARALVAPELDALADRVDPAAAGTLIGTAGTVTTLAALHLGLDAYRPEAIHGARLPADAVADLTARLCAMTTTARRGLPPMEPGRADVIAAGAIILDEVLRRFGHEEVLVSEADILDGITLSLLR